jgi:hypothetical protein
MRFQGRGADGSFELLFIAASAGSDSIVPFENGMGLVWMYQ